MWRSHFDCWSSLGVWFGRIFHSIFSMLFSSHRFSFVLISTGSFQHSSWTDFLCCCRAVVLQLHVHLLCGFHFCDFSFVFIICGSIIVWHVNIVCISNVCLSTVWHLSLQYTRCDTNNDVAHREKGNAPSMRLNKWRIITSLCCTFSFIICLQCTVKIMHDACRWRP